MNKILILMAGVAIFSTPIAFAKVDRDILDNDEAKKTYDSISGETLYVEISTMEETSKKNRKVVAATTATEEAVIRPLNIKIRENDQFRCEKTTYWVGYKDIPFLLGEIGSRRYLPAVGYRCFDKQ